MMRSLFAGVSGLKNHQTKMDVIGNNIANVNTVGFKKSRVTFQDMLSQTLRGSSSPTANRAGTNPLQVGLGMTLASIDVIHTGGSPQSTGKNTDLSVEGEGFFLLGEGSNLYYTRAGNFDFDFNKTFYNTSNGMVVKGYLADSNGEIPKDATLTDINLASQVSSNPNPTTEIQYAKNLGVITETVEDVSFTNGSGDVTYTLPVNDISEITVMSSTGTVLASPGDFTYVPATGVVTILDAGTAVTGTYNIIYKHSKIEVPMMAYDSNGKTHQVMVTLTKDFGVQNRWSVAATVNDNPPLPGGAVTGGTGKVTFKTDGTFDASTVTPLAVNLSSIGAANLTINLDLTKLTQYAAETTAIASGQDGYGPGDLTGVAVDTSGTITGSFSNGQSRKLAQLALATFANPSGLMKVGNNLFQPTNNSGVADTGIPGLGGRGTIKPETLEMSNVDLSQEFVDMIITQRGFQANSRVITTSDQILEELVNLRR